MGRFCAVGHVSNRNMRLSVDADVFVVGAGPAGLTAAYYLTKEIRSVLVIEKDPVHVGGISRTVNYNGFLFDMGGHRSFSKSKEVTDLWREILPDDRRRNCTLISSGVSARRHWLALDR